MPSPYEQTPVLLDDANVQFRDPLRSARGAGWADDGRLDAKAKGGPVRTTGRGRTVCRQGAATGARRCPRSRTTYPPAPPGAGVMHDAPRPHPALTRDAFQRRSEAGAQNRGRIDF